MEKIKEEELEEKLQSFKGKDLYIEITGFIIQKLLLKKANINFLKSMTNFEISDDINKICFDFSFIQEIILLEKNKIKFFLENNFEVILFY